MNRYGASMAKLRREMVDGLRRKGIGNERVLEAMESVERHRFVDEKSHARAYDDSACPIGYGQTISQPYTVAYMTTLLLERCPLPAKVLEIGTGSGYQAAVLDALGYQVFTVERLPALHRRAVALFGELGLPIACRLGDGSLGWPEESPFDGIIVTAAAPHCPDHLLQQLADNGCLVIPVGEQDLQQMTIYRRIGMRYEKELFQYFAFVPLIGREGWN
ncbi:protein-L-isoaspartate(D-aspartate) O-methyltransferase [Chlorobium sp.]|uniref:protein-L-isoaspartate(D-aspartate) O-methyltransferase n=1 Tax=Chlorobium sp. TaxID=1095 RepID=UPI0025BC4A4D|nr:protein-L-isoaspartate(D-aspartate) O-methyltransferase [Chlorobium sp.]